MLPINSNRSLSQQTRKKGPSSPLYLPAVYRYTCRGIFSASSQERGSAGHCQGIRSAIEHIIDMDPMTREEALKNFTGDNMISDEDVGLAIEDGRTNPALIYPPLPAKTTTKEHPSSKGIIGNENDDDDEEDRIVAVDPVGTASDVDNNKIDHESWSAFGSTEVECLQLTDLKNGSTEIVALAPYNAALVSTRKIVMDDRRITSTEIGLGPYKMQFLVETTHVDVVDRRNEQEQTTIKRPESSVVATDSDAAATPRSNNIFPLLPVLTMDSVRQYLEQGHEFSGRVYDFSLKMVDQMHFQTTWLYRNLQGDFLARTVASGNRMIAEMPRTVSIFGKVFRSLFGTDNDDHHDD